MSGFDRSGPDAPLYDGVEALVVCAQVLGVEPPSDQGNDRGRARWPGDLRQLNDLASTHGFVARIVRLAPDTYHHLPFPTVLQRRDGGFLILDGIVAGRCRVRGASANRWLLAPGDLENLCDSALEITGFAAVAPRRARPAISVFSLLQLTPAIKSGLVQSIILSVALQLYVLVAPLFMRSVVDVVIVENDADLLNALVLGFAALAVFNTGALFLRGVAVRNLSADLNWNITRRIFHHLIRLPLEWFSAQRLGDVLSKVQGTDQVRSYITGATGIVLDGAFSLLTLGALAMFSPALALVSGFGLALYIAIRIATAPYLMRLSRDGVISAGVEQGKRIETLRAIQTVKVMGAEQGRERDWSSTLAVSITRAQAQALAASNFASLQSLISTLTNVAFLYFGAMAVLGGHLTVGVLTAALAYHSQFNQRASSLFEQILAYRLLDVQLERVADIVLEPAEIGLDQSSSGEPIRGRIELIDVGFSYDPSGPSVFDNINLTVDVGEHVAISGPSGCGKSTLIKLLCGLYRPSRGVIAVDGQTIDQLGLPRLRSALGVVMQDDQLIAGSVIENITFFSEDIDTDLVWDCLERARIDREIRALPAGLRTEVGDMGVALSGGQKQRLLIARALYRKPRILLLDEATSNLDVTNEQSIISTLRDLNMTRIVISHRPETLASADRIVFLPHNLSGERAVAS